MKSRLNDNIALKSDLIKFHFLDKNNNRIIDEKKVEVFLKKLDLFDLYDESKCFEHYLIETEFYKIINPICYINLFTIIQEDQRLIDILDEVVDETKNEIADIIIIELEKINFFDVDEKFRKELFNKCICELKTFILKELLGEVSKNKDLDIHPTEERINIAYDALNAFIRLDGWRHIEYRYAG